MRTFQFRFAAVLSERDARLNAAQSALAVAQRNLNEAEAQASALRARMQANLSHGAGCGVVVDPRRSLVRMRHAHGLRAELDRVAQIVSRLEKRCEAERDRVVEARRELEIIERLRERDLTRWRDRVRRLEQAELDELNIQRRFGRPSQGGAVRSTCEASCAGGARRRGGAG